MERPESEGKREPVFLPIPGQLIFVEDEDGNVRIAEIGPSGGVPLRKEANDAE
jgi:hypothetical protein